MGSLAFVRLRRSSAIKNPAYTSAGRLEGQILLFQYIINYLNYRKVEHQGQE